jgi:hypothetical protein
VPVDIDRDDARDAATRELADPVYRAAEPSWFDRALTWLGEQLGELFSGASSIAPGGWVGLVVLAMVVVIVVVAVRLRVGRLARTRRHRPTVFDGHPRSADEHRRAAENALSRGELTQAVLERFRAIVRELEHRGVLDEQAGRTVDEIAVQTGQVLPELAGDLRNGARIIDDVLYGGRAATMSHHRTLAELDARLQTQRTFPVGTR